MTRLEATKKKNEYKRKIKIFKWYRPFMYLGMIVLSCMFILPIAVPVIRNDNKLILITSATSFIVGLILMIISLIFYNTYKKAMDDKKKLYEDIEKHGITD